MFFLLSLALIILSGCGTLLVSSEKTVILEPMPDSTEVYIQGQFMGVTPLSLNLDNQETHNITFRKEGHDPAICRLEPRVLAGIVALDIIFGVFPFIVDAMSGNWKALKDNGCTVVLRADE